MSKKIVLAACVLPALLLLGGGCGQGDAPVAVSGWVTYDGEPIADGLIVFEPTNAEKGQVRQAAIAHGRFGLPAAEGVLPHLEFRVAIKAFRKTGRKYPNRDMGQSYDEVEQFLPSAYNASSTLRVTTSHQAAENEFTFALESRPKQAP